MAESSKDCLVIAPFLSGQYFCKQAHASPAVFSDEDAALFCAARRENAADRITAALDTIGPKTSPSGKYQLGYTLTVPLFRYFRRVNDEWEFDGDSLKENLETVAGVDRPVVVYLSSNHFIDAGAVLCKELAEDPVNLMWNRNGPMLPGPYFNSSVIPWTLEAQGAPVTVLRRRAFSKVVRAIRSLPEASRDKIVAISLLGELHHMFPGFRGGPGFNSPLFEGTDYAPLAVAGFREWLARTYNTISVLNDETGANFASFEEITPPSKDINTEQLNSFFEHIDVHAAGYTPIYGWFHDEAGRDFKIAVYLSGRLQGFAETGLSRTDVTDALPSVRTPNVGFRFKLDHRDVPRGIHILEILVHTPGAAALRLARQELVLVSRTQERPPAVHCIDTHVPPTTSDPRLSGALDGPKPWAAAFYNPMARLWLAYRNHVVRNYIEQFAQLASDAGIPKQKLFSHQVTPELIGSWNGDLLAAHASKLPSKLYNQGTTLYGGAAFGSAFPAMKSALGWDRYAVSEMHPLVRLTPDEYSAMFEMHRTQGAVFVAPYFMYIGPERLRAGGDEHERFRIAPDNPRMGSDAYWHALRNVMNS